jgi:hypothetical protein
LISADLPSRDQVLFLYLEGFFVVPATVMALRTLQSLVS